MGLVEKRKFAIVLGLTSSTIMMKKRFRNTVPRNYVYLNLLLIKYSANRRIHLRVGWVSFLISPVIFLISY